VEGSADWVAAGAQFRLSALAVLRFLRKAGDANALHPAAM
jgi:hypothetical protein